MGVEVSVETIVIILEEGFMALSMTQEMAIHDNNGRVRCPICGKFRKKSDFPTQPGHSHIGYGKNISGHIHLLPSCEKCLGGEKL